MYLTRNDFCGVNLVGEKQAVDCSHLDHQIWTHEILFTRHTGKICCSNPCTEENLQESILNVMFWTLPAEPDMQWTTYCLCVMSVCGPKERNPQNFIFNSVSRVILTGIHWLMYNARTSTLKYGNNNARTSRPFAWKVMRIARNVTSLYRLVRVLRDYNDVARDYVGVSV